MNDLLKLGYLKVDVLGLTNLTVIYEILKKIFKNYHKKINLYKINFEDQNVYELLSKGHTEGIFH